jgi:hypothetical protein
LIDVVIGRAGKPLQKVLEIAVRLDAVHAAVLNERVYHCIAPARFFRAEKQPVLFFMESLS